MGAKVEIYKKNSINRTVAHNVTKVGWIMISSEMNGNNRYVRQSAVIHRGKMIGILGKRTN